MTSGAAVQTDSLQLVLELIRAQVEALRQRNALRTAQLELGRRVGASARLTRFRRHRYTSASFRSPCPRRYRIGLDQGPQYRAARANESSAGAALRPNGGTTCRSSASAGCTSATTPRSFPARPTSPR